jgi:acyl carrier protein
VDLPADLTSRLRSLSAEQLSVEPMALRADALLTDDLGVDSLAAIEWGMTIEDELGVTFPEDAWEHVRTYGQVEDLVAQLLGAQVR